MSMIMIRIINFIKQLIRNDKEKKELDKKRKIIKEDYAIGEKIAHDIFNNDFEPKNEFIPTSIFTEYT